MSRPAKYISGDLVFAKVKGYPPWPARVTSVKSSRYKIFFYGTLETATLKKEDMWPYNQENEDKFAPKNLKRKWYSEGLDQIKNSPEIAPVEDESMEISLDTSSMNNTDASVVIEENPKQKQTSEVASKEKADTVSSPKSTPKPTPITKATAALKTNNTPISSIPSENSTPASAHGSKRKATDIPTVNAPSGKRPSIDDSPAEHEMMSRRSGRVLKPNDNVIASTQPVSETEEDGDGPDADTPSMPKIKKLVKPEAEKDMLKKDKSFWKEKLEWIKIEEKVMDLNISIKTALHVERPSPQDCITALVELGQLDIKPLMIKKQPDIVTTIRRLRKYVGPRKYVGLQKFVNWPDKELRELMEKQIETIQTKADQIYSKFKLIFNFQEGEQSFWQELETMVQEFRKKTEKMEESQILALIRDPTESHRIVPSTSVSDMEDNDEGNKA